MRKKLLVVLTLVFVLGFGGFSAWAQIGSKSGSGKSAPSESSRATREIGSTGDRSGGAYNSPPSKRSEERSKSSGSSGYDSNKKGSSGKTSGGGYSSGGGTVYASPDSISHSDDSGGGELSDEEVRAIAELIFFLLEIAWLILVWAVQNWEISLPVLFAIGLGFVMYKYEPFRLFKEWIRTFLDKLAEKRKAAIAEFVPEVDPAQTLEFWIKLICGQVFTVNNGTTIAAETAYANMKKLVGSADNNGIVEFKVLETITIRTKIARLQKLVKGESVSMGVRWFYVQCPLNSEKFEVIMLHYDPLQKKNPCSGAVVFNSGIADVIFVDGKLFATSIGGQKGGEVDYFLEDPGTIGGLADVAPPNPDSVGYVKLGKFVVQKDAPEGADHICMIFEIRTVGADYGEFHFLYGEYLDLESLSAHSLE